MSGQSVGFVLRNAGIRRAVAMLLVALLAASTWQSLRPVWISGLHRTAALNFIEGPSATQAPINITQGPDGRMYYVGFDAFIDAQTLDGSAVTKYPIPSGCSAHDLALGPDAALWFTEPNCNKIGRMDAAGTINEYPIPHTASIGMPWDIVRGADLNLWFTLSRTNCSTGSDCPGAIGRVIPAGGLIQLFATPKLYANPTEIALGPDDNVWFAEPGAASLGRAQQDGTITDFPTTSAASQLTVASDGRLWFSGGPGNTYGVMNITGEVSLFTYPVGTGGTYLTQDLITGLDGNAWFSAVRKNDPTSSFIAVVGTIDSGGNIVDYQLPPASASCCQRSPAGMATDTDGRIWYVDPPQTIVGHTDPITSGGSGGPGSTQNTQGGGNPSQHSTQCSRGHPVNCATGEFWHEFPDLSIGGRGLGLLFDRTYSSVAASVDGPLGFGWTHSYNMAITFGSGGTIDVHQENGSTVTFRPVAGGYQAAPRVLASLSRDVNGQYSFTRNDQTRFVFGADGRLLSEEDRNGYQTSLTYDSSRHLAAVTDPAGRRLTLQYLNGHIARVNDPIGRFVAFEYDAAGQLVRAADVGGGITRFRYSTNHLLAGMTDPRGGVLTNLYDSRGRVVSQTDPRGIVTIFSYTPTGTLITDGNGFVTKEVYTNGELVSLTSAAGTAEAATWTFTYDAATLGITSETDPNGHTSTYRWDARGNLLTATDPLGNTTAASYNPINDPVSVVDPGGLVTELSYDAHGNLVGGTGHSGATALSSFQLVRDDPSHPGDVTAYVDPNGNRWTFSSDAAGNITKRTDPLGNASASNYDGIGRLVAAVSARGNRTTFQYNAFGDPTKIVDPLGNVTELQYDANRNPLTATDAEGRTTSYTYDADGEVVRIVNPDRTTSTTAYDGNGNVTRTTDGLGRSSNYAYDALNQLVSGTDPLGRVSRSTYDRGGNQLSLADPLSNVTSYAYDASNRTTAIAYSDGKTANVAFAYDADGHRVSMTDGSGPSQYKFDGLGRMIRATDGAGRSVGYGYDPSGRITSITYPDNSIVTRKYDKAGRQQSVTDWVGNTTRFATDPDGHVVTETYPNNTVATFKYDAAGRLAGIRDSRSGDEETNIFLNFDYSRNALGFITRVGSNGTVQDDGNHSGRLEYDSLGRLIRSAGDRVRTYQYDAAGQLTLASVRDNITTLMTYDAGSQLTSLTRARGGAVVASTSFAYDQNGNRTKQVPSAGPATNYSYDQVNRLVKLVGPRPSTHVTGDQTDATDNQTGDHPGGHDTADAVAAAIVTATYAYNGDGLRTAKTVNSKTEAFSWDVADGMPVILQDGSTRYVTDPSGVALEQVLADGTVRYYHQDQLGSTRALTDARGDVVQTYSYDDYGKLLAERPIEQNPLLFGGQYLDAESGLYMMRARYYDPATAQFLTVDPISAATGVRYGYAADNPANFTDPSGLACSAAPWDWGSCVQSAVGTLTSSSTISAAQCAITKFQGVVTHSFDVFSGFVDGLLLQRSVISRLMKAVSPQTRSYAGGLLRSAGRVVKRNPWLESFSRRAPFVGLVISLAINLLSGESLSRALFETALAGLIGILGGIIGAFICGLEAVATAGLGLLACPIIIATAGLIFGIIGDIAAPAAADWIGVK